MATIRVVCNFRLLACREKKGLRPIYHASSNFLQILEIKIIFLSLTFSVKNVILELSAHFLFVKFALSD